MPKLSASAKLFIGLVVLGGLATLVSGLLRWECKDLIRFFSFLVVAALASRLKVSLPGINGSMSVNVPFLLIAALELSLGEAIVIAAVSTFIQCLPSGGRRMQVVQVLFNVTTLVLAVAAGAAVFARGVLMPNLAGKALFTVMAGLAYLLVDTVPVAAVISLVEHKDVVGIWTEIFNLTFPYFGFSAAIAAVAVTAAQHAGWQFPLFIAPVMALTYVSYKRYFANVVPATQKFRASAAAAD